MAAMLPAVTVEAATTVEAVREQTHPQPESQTTTSHVAMTHLLADDRNNFPTTALHSQPLSKWKPTTFQ